MEKVGIITESNMLWSGLNATSQKRGISLFRTPIENLKRQAMEKNLPDVILIDFPKRNSTFEDILESFCIENPEVLMIILGDKVESTFLKSYSYLVAPRIVNYAFIMDIVVNTLAYKSLLLKEAQRHQKVIDFEKKKEITNSQRHKELLIARNGELLIQRERLQREREKFQNGFGEIIEFLLQTIEYQDPVLANHSKYIAKLAHKIGINLDMNSEELAILEWSSLLHDIGKLEQTSKGRNTDSIQRHAVVGEALLSRIELLRPIAPIIRSHHERFDGTGLPDKISGDEIPLESRIIAMCNTIAIINHDGKYENDTDIAQELIVKSGFSLDPELVDLMLKFMDSDKIIDDNEFFTVRPQELEEGMQLFEDLYTSHGLFLIPSGQVLTQQQINRIQSFHRIAPVIGGVKIIKNNIEEFERSNGGRKQA